MTHRGPFLLLLTVLSLGPAMPILAQEPASPPYALTVCIREDNQLRLVNVDLDGRMTKFGPEPLGGSHPAWSPDGTRLVFQRGNQLAAVAADGTGLHVLTKPKAMKGFPSFSPDGSKITYEVHDYGLSAEERKTEQANEIFVMNADGSEPQNISLHPAVDLWPAWSPDGEWIAFGSDRANGWLLWIMKADGSEQQALTKSTGYWTCPAWSPDGRLLAYGVFNGKGTQFAISVLDRETNKTRQITGHETPNENDLYPAWSPDGRFLAWAHYEPFPNDANDISEVIGDLVVYDTVLETRRTLLEDRLPRYGARPAWRPFPKSTAAD